MAEIHKLFKYLTEHDASDLHLAAGLVPAIRVHGEVVPIQSAPPLDDAMLQGLLYEIVDDVQWGRYVQTGDLDFACALEGVGRFRANYFMQQTGAAAVFRRVPESVVPIEKLGLPPVIARLAQARSGLTLVTGPTGSGKSTTLAAMIDHLNRTASRHIVTVEDPVEFVHPNLRSVITQREVGTDTRSFAAGLTTAMRQDADVILVGEMRDLETISTALDAASMGVLVFGTLHTSSAAKSVDRIIDAFDADRQPLVRNTLADALVGVVSQILVRRRDGRGRVAAHEILLKTSAMPNAIRDGNVAMLHSIIGAGRGVGMQTMDDTLLNLANTGVISGRDAYLKAADKARFANLADAD